MTADQKNTYSKLYGFQFATRKFWDFDGIGPVPMAAEAMVKTTETSTSTSESNDDGNSDNSNDPVI